MDSVCEDQLLQRTVMRFATARFERLAAEIVAPIRACPPCGITGDDECAETLWDEYCHDQQNGPAPLLAYAWDDLFAPHLTAAIARLDRTEATLLTFYCCWDRSEDPLEIVGSPPIGIDEDALRAAIMDEVTKLALN